MASKWPGKSGLARFDTTADWEVEPAPLGASHSRSAVAAAAAADGGLTAGDEEVARFLAGLVPPTSAPEARSAEDVARLLGGIEPLTLAPEGRPNSASPSRCAAATAAAAAGGGLLTVGAEEMARFLAGAEGGPPPLCTGARSVGGAARGPPDGEEVRGRLAPCQRAALAHVDAAARVLHERALPGLRARVRGLGFAAGELDECLEYIRDDAPIVVHLREGTLAKLCGDPWYRSQFETGTSGGTLDRAKRQLWEDSMFGGAYAGATDADHPKYGALNITGDILGVRRARFYGKCFMILAPSVRHRTTFANQDTGRAKGRESLATNNWYAHVLMGYSDEELRTVLRVSSTSRLGGAPSTSITKYKECQIHGPLSIASDVLALSVPNREVEASSQLRGVVEAFRKISNCNVLWQGDLLEDASPNSEERRKERIIRMLVQLLEHASRCKSSRCSSPGCPKMKMTLNHIANCKLKASGGCKTCKRTWTVLRIHARQWRVSRCHIPHCTNIKGKVLVRHLKK